MSYHSTLFALVALMLLLPSLRADQKKKPDPNRPILRVVYFVPTDRKPEPEFRARIDRVLTDVQDFYRKGMHQNGYGKLTFELDRDSKDGLRIYEVKAKGPMRDYGRNAADKVRREVKVALAKEKLDIDNETIVIFQLLLDWQNDKAIEIGPYVGGGGPRSGTAWVYDDAKLDTKLLSSKKPGGYYNGACSLGQFNTHYIGGVAHELGHALGLPHDCERDADRARLGLSLMGGGNHTYGQELRSEGKGAFLSPASALPLSVHPLFTGKRKTAAPLTCRLAELKAEHDKGKFVLTGQFQGGPKVIGLVARNDSEKPAGDYDAVGWTCTVDAEGKFSLAIGELKPGPYDLRLTAYGESGDAKSFVFRYQIDAKRQPDLRPFAEAVQLQEAHAAFGSKDKKRLAAIFTAMQKQYPADAQPLRKVSHLQKLLAQPVVARSLADVAEKETTVAVADLKFEKAEVGWGAVLRNQVLVEGEGSCLLTVGGTFYESGLYAHAPARHVLLLDGKWNQFTTKYGLQDGYSGSVVFVVKGDGKELFRSKPVRDHIAREQKVEVGKVKLLELIVEDAGDGASSDWGVWLEPRLRR